MKRFLCRFYPMVLLLISTAAIATAQPKEHHLANVRQLTFGGDNAEAYFNQTTNRGVIHAIKFT